MKRKSWHPVLPAEFILRAGPESIIVVQSEDGEGLRITRSVIRRDDESFSIDLEKSIRRDMREALSRMIFDRMSEDQGAHYRLHWLESEYKDHFPFETVLVTELQWNTIRVVERELCS